ncbi:hypothetical protein GJ496_010390 [Pomphorhynchus laevis]|nr:hypothetical protein GJ496_010390 [Pomphorhynchus laevis]
MKCRGSGINWLCVEMLSGYSLLNELKCPLEVDLWKSYFFNSPPLGLGNEIVSFVRSTKPFVSIFDMQSLAMQRRTI